MKLKTTLLLFIIQIGIVFSQTASSYLPTTVGNVWKFKTQALDSAGVPTGPIISMFDSTLAFTSFLGKQTLISIRKTEEGIMFDSSWYAAQGSSIYTHMRSIELDTFEVKLPDWFETYRFGASLGSRYTIFQLDTTLTIPGMGTLPLRFVYRGTRLGTESITVPAGTFNAMTFKTEIVIQYRISLPPPLPPLLIDLFSLPVQDWLAQDRFIVKSRQEPLYVDSLGLNIPGQIEELEEFRPPSTSVEGDLLKIDYKLYQNYPNPFNPSTVISFQLSAVSQVSIRVFDILGREVAVLVDEVIGPGIYNYPFSILHYPLRSSVYFYQLKAGNFVETKKMVYLK
ncbi:MAG: T9SS type A sorting domain-containing protein [Ignavibacteria bacterium]|nr:T9SS type A sorting domain-containing protein [Ignavibacteria bacterium]